MKKAKLNSAKALRSSMRRKKTQGPSDEYREEMKLGRGKRRRRTTSRPPAPVTRAGIISARLRGIITREAQKSIFDGFVTIAGGSVTGIYERATFVASAEEVIEACGQLIDLVKSFQSNEDGSVELRLTLDASTILSGRIVNFRKRRTPTKPGNAEREGGNGAGAATPDYASRQPNPQDFKGPAKEVIDQLIRAVREMEAFKLLATWQNAVRTLANPARKSWHADADRLANAISCEWDRRGEAGFEDEWFKWPESDALGGSRKHAREGFRAEGMLAYLEYRVGRNGETTPYRQVLLDRIFTHTLPPVFDKAYMAQWGPNASSIRLHKMAHCLASFARNAKYRDDDRLDEAIRHWEQDLEYLFHKYYVGKFRFGWPSSVVS